MPKDYDKDSGISETGNWNVANDFAKLKIMKPLYLADEYQNIALFGSSSLIEELNNPLPVEYLKLKGFKRLVHTLISIIDNSKFAVTRDKDKKLLTDYKKLLVEILEKYYPKCFETISSQRTGSSKIKINESFYKSVLEKVMAIKSAINSPLNRADLIFTNKEEFDPKAYKEQIMRMASQRG